jgi:hypothetical protein
MSAEKNFVKFCKGVDGIFWVAVTVVLAHFAVIPAVLLYRWIIK